MQNASTCITALQPPTLRAAGLSSQHINSTPTPTYAEVQNTSAKNNNSNNSRLPRCIHFFAAADNACIEIQATVHGAAKLSLLTLRLDRAPVSQIHSQKQPVHPSLKKGASSPAGHLVSRRFPDSGYCFACPPVPTCSSGREFL